MKIFQYYKKCLFC